MAHHARSAFPFNNGDSSSDTWKQFSENDTQTLIPEEEKPDVLQTIKAITADVLKNHLKLFIVICDLVVVFILTLCFLGMHTLSCEDSARQDLLEWCQPFVPVDQVIVDLSFDLLVHCDRPVACVAHAQTLAERQGFNYNFIIGDEDLVYVGKGYQCKSDALRLQMLITRYTWDPKQPLYRVPMEVVIRYSEVLYEGVRCGMVFPNYTVRVTCSMYGEYCGADNIRDRIPWTLPKPLAFVRDRQPWFEPEPGSHAFLAFDTDRVYDKVQRLRSCNTTLPQQGNRSNSHFL